MLPGQLANPTPGTMVVHVNGKVQVDFQATWGSLDQHVVTATSAQAGRIGNATTAPAGSPGATPLSVTVPAGGFAAGSTVTIPNTPLGTALGQNGVGSVKVMPQAIDSFARLYMGVDAMATNGLRYGAAIEMRQNFIGQISNNGVRAPAATPRSRRCSCGAPSPTSPASSGASCASARPTA